MYSTAAATQNRVHYPTLQVTTDSRFIKVTVLQCHKLINWGLSIPDWTPWNDTA